MIPDTSPHHHLHVSTGFLFVLALAVIAIVALVLYWRDVREERRLESEARIRASLRRADRAYAFEDERRTRRAPGSGPTGYTRNPGYVGSAPLYTPPASTVVVQNDTSGDLLTGVLLGEMMADRHDRVAYEAPVYAEPVYEAPADSGFSYDSGSYDSGSSDSSGGFDIDW